MILAAILLAVPAGTAFTCTPVAVWDGDGPVWCAEGPKIRLAGIAAREIDETCKTGHPCPPGSGKAARDALVRLLGGSPGQLSAGHIRVAALPISCVSEGSAGGSRTAAWCRTRSGVDLSCAMVRSGLAVRRERYWRGHRCS